MSGFISIPNRALHDYTWNVCGFFIICIRWLLLPFYFFFLIFIHCIIFLFVTWAQFYGWVNPAGVLRMFYCSFQKSVVLCWMSAWMKITLKEGGILAWDHFPQKSWKFDHYLGSGWTVCKRTYAITFLVILSICYFDPPISRFPENHFKDTDLMYKELW